jgi:anthranilate synthase component 1
MISADPVPTREQFRELALPGSIVPVYLEFAFDVDTPVTAYAKLQDGPFGFLLESVEGGERWARYSFVGSRPREAWRLDGGRIDRWSPETGWQDQGETTDPFADFQRWVGQHQPVHLEGLPRFWGGAVGYFGYDTVRWIEKLPGAPVRDVEVPDACFMATDRILIIDNLWSRAYALRAVPIAAQATLAQIDQLYEESVAALHRWLERLIEPSGLEPLALGRRVDVQARANRTEADFEAAVARIGEYIRAGDAFQVVVSQRAEASMPEEPLDVYRALRMINPSPYLFYLELDGVRLIGSSPESLVRVESGQVAVRPIAGTRPRGKTPAEDRQLEEDLVACEKERAEHLMLVDLGRNDVGRVAAAGTVRIPQFMKVERYSHVMHLVSEVTGQLEEDLTPIDALKACFPAGTLTGAPKVRAMEIIDELEPTRRGPYGGATGYVGYGATSLDMAIVIRTILGVGDRAFAQAGAGIVYDSEPVREWEETRAKARVLLRALGRALGQSIQT